MNYCMLPFTQILSMCLVLEVQVSFQRWWLGGAANKTHDTAIKQRESFSFAYLSYVRGKMYKCARGEGSLLIVGVICYMICLPANKCYLEVKQKIYHV